MLKELGYKEALVSFFCLFIFFAFNFFLTANIQPYGFYDQLSVHSSGSLLYA